MGASKGVTMKTLKKLVFNSLYFALVYFAYIENIVYCENIFVFLTWMYFVFLLIGIFSAKKDDAVLHSLKENESKVSNMSLVLTAIMVAFLAALGHWVLAIVWLLQPFMFLNIVKKVKGEI